MRTAKLTFLACLAVGYELGCKSGRESYDKVSKSVKSMLATEQVQDAVSAVKRKLKDQAREIAAKVGARTGLCPPTAAQQMRDSAGKTRM